MRSFIVAAMFLLAGTSVPAQTTSDTKVIALTPEETQEAKAIEQARKDLDDRANHLRDSIVQRHLVTNVDDGSTCAYRLGGYIRNGWGCGVPIFEFTSDYLFIVNTFRWNTMGNTIGNMIATPASK